MNELLLECFEEPRSRIVLHCLASLARLHNQAEDIPNGAGISLARLRSAVAESAADVRYAVLRLAEPPSLVVVAATARSGDRVALAPPVREARAEVGGMAEAYLAAVAEFGSLPPPEDALARAYRQAQICFDLGLFFEAHEILEAEWRPLPAGALRTFLQGLIQISVGFHHAGRGNHAGTVNQLGKGLEKLDYALARYPDPLADAFRQAVSGVRGRVLRAGRERMRPVPSPEVPPFPRELPPAFRAKAGGISP
jgi:hypothetical protein